MSILCGNAIAPGPDGPESISPSISLTFSQDDPHTRARTKTRGSRWSSGLALAGPGRRSIPARLQLWACRIGHYATSRQNQRLMAFHCYHCQGRPWPRASTGDGKALQNRRSSGLRRYEYAFKPAGFHQTTSTWQHSRRSGRFLAMGPGRAGRVAANSCQLSGSSRAPTSGAFRPG